jgi:hypothetical protein
MGNSSYTVQNLVDIARAMGDLAPTLPTGGAYETVALSAINDAMTAMLAGSSKGSPFNFKFNRIIIPPFFINSWQQDYASNVVNLGWLESCGAWNTSSTQYPKPFAVVDVRRDVLITSLQTTGSNNARIAWMQNDTMTFGTWGVSQINSLTGIQNPGPGAVYTSPLGATSMPSNPITQVQDSFGNLWLVTTYGTCGNTNPFLSNLNPVFPTLAKPSTVATTVTDGSVTWTAINPKAAGFRIYPGPSQTGPVWQIAPIGQAKIQQFTKLNQFIEPIPDDYFSYIKTGFFAQCYRFSPDPKLRTKFDMEFKLWMQALDNAVRQGSREQDDWGFVPMSNVMETGWAYNSVNPAQPYGPWGI